MIDPKEMSEILNKQFKLVSNAKSHKRIENVHTFYEWESLRTTRIHDISFTEEDIEQIFGNLNEHTTAEPDTWNAKILKTIQKPLSDYS